MYKLDNSFPSIACISFEPPPTFSVIALISENIDNIFENIDNIFEIIFNVFYGLFHVSSSYKPSL